MLKWIVSITLALLICSNLFLIYSFIDQAVTSKYHDMVKYERQQQVEQLKSITKHFVSGLHKDELTKLLDELGYKPFEKEGAIHISFVAFEFDDKGMVTTVRNSFSYDPEYNQVHPAK